VSALRRRLNQLAPRTLFWRSLLIVVLPLLLLQIVLTVIFYNRHWDTVTRWLASGVAGEVALLAEELESTRDWAAEEAAIDRVRRHTDLRVSLEPNGTLDAALATAGIDSDPRGRIDSKILQAFEEKLSQRRFAVDLRGQEDDRVAVYVQLDDALLRVLAGRKRVTSTTTWLLLAWMVGASLALTALALYFLRLQVRPIRRLARAAESFGKGRDVGDVRLQGALEIRQAAHAFNLMRHRILRHVGQRTELLAAVSHDLRTPLTRMKLALELAGAEADPALGELRPTSTRWRSWSRATSPSPAARAGRRSSPPTSCRSWTACASGPSAAGWRWRSAWSGRRDPAAAPARVPPLPREPGRQRLPLRGLDRRHRAT
jgi:two-component system osmolarity sensor histidine kinase EnvZ